MTVGPPADLLVLGCGYAGRTTALLARSAGQSVRVTTRSQERARSLGAEGLEVVHTGPLDRSVEAHVGVGTHVVVAFPPDGETERRVADGLAGAASVAFISTTGVYPERAGRVDDETRAATPVTERTRRWLDAERTFLAVGATILRCPGIYGPDRGLHVRVLRGAHRIPGDGTRSTSRIHVHDVAQLLLASRRRPGATFVVGDLAPTTHLEIVEWLCATYRLPLPPFAPLDEVPVSLRADRRVDPSGALEALGVELVYPTYRTGMHPNATGLSSPSG